MITPKCRFLGLRDFDVRYGGVRPVLVGIREVDAVRVAACKELPRERARRRHLELLDAEQPRASLGTQKAGMLSRNHCASANAVRCWSISSVGHAIGSCPPRPIGAGSVG